ncbi:hypothetical protein C7S15_4793 [Burkholderia cepacia]|nr:hypothetical protein [Burkholderia cepacia]
MKRNCHDCRKLRKIYCLQAACDTVKISPRREDDDDASSFRHHVCRGPA